jgi:tetratricopeptide (TPR) repeat protein
MGSSKNVINLIGSIDSLDNYIKETQNKVSNLYNNFSNKMRLTPKQASQMYFLFGKTFLKLKNSHKAEEMLILSHVYNPKHFNVAFLLATIFLEQNNLKKAEKFYKKCHAINPTNEESLYGLIDSNYKLKNYVFLLEFVKNLNVQLVTSTRVALLLVKYLLNMMSLNLFVIVKDNKQITNIIKVYLELSEELLESRQSYYLPTEQRNLIKNEIVIYYYKIQMYQNGINCLTKSPYENSNSLINYNLAYGYFKIYNYQSALEYINSSLKAEPADKRALLLKAEILKKMGKIKETMDILQNLHANNQNDFIINRMLGDVFKFKGSYFQAIDHYEVISLIIRRLWLQRTLIKAYWLRLDSCNKNLIFNI